MSPCSTLSLTFSVDILPSLDLTEFDFGEMILSSVPGSHEDAEATACERFDCEARPHVKRSKGHRYSVMARYVSERIWPQ